MLLQHGGKRLVFNVVEDEVGRVAFGGINRDKEVGVLQNFPDGKFPLEPLVNGRVAELVQVRQLEGNLAVFPEIVRKVSVRVAALPEQLFNSISSADHRSGFRGHHNTTPSRSVSGFARTDRFVARFARADADGVGNRPGEDLAVADLSRFCRPDDGVGDLVDNAVRNDDCYLSQM